jgi:hypothetical protein
MFLWISKYREKKKTRYCFQCLLESLCLFKKIKLNFSVFPISYTRLHVISYKCKYVLFHLNMLRLFQKINIFVEIKLIFNKNFSFKYLIQGFNLHLLSCSNVYPL